jgi:required for meiotic nuclear division protein 1
MATGYLMQAINLYDSINVKTIRPIVSGKVLSSSTQELQVQYGENSYLFVYKFGCVVFFNMSNEQIDAELNKIKAALGNGLPNPTTETYQVNVGDFPLKVEFEYVEVKKLSLDYLRMIAISIGQSAALEYFELSADRMLYDTTTFMQKMARLGRIPFQSKQLVKIIGSTASTRQHIISNVAILDPPEDTWKSKELEKFHKDLQSNFDIDTRFKTLDRKLTLTQDNIEILADFTSTRRMAMLEAAIVILIVVELVIALAGKL